MTFDQLMTAGERLGLPALFYLMLFRALCSVGKWLGSRIDKSGTFAAPLIKDAAASHIRFLETTSDELPKTTTAIQSIGDWLAERWPNPKPTAPKA